MPQLTLFDAEPHTAGWYNTPGERGATRVERDQVAGEQERAVLMWFRQHAEGSYSADQVRVYAFFGSGMRPLLTSVRRAVTNLTKAGYLEKTDERIMGPYGVPVGKWRLAGVSNHG